MWCTFNPGLSLVDYAQIGSAIGTLIAALCALITTYQNSQIGSKMDLERHAMVKPFFKIQGFFEQRLEKKIDFYILNVGFDKFRSIDATWEGSEGVKVKLNECGKNEENDYIIRLEARESHLPTENVQGQLVLFYIDILGKSYTETVDILIKNHHDDLTESDTPILQGNLVGRRFV